MPRPGRHAGSEPDPPLKEGTAMTPTATGLAPTTTTEIDTIRPVTGPIQTGSLTQPIEIVGRIGDRYDEVLTPEAIAFLAALHQRFAGRRHALRPRTSQAPGDVRPARSAADQRRAGRPAVPQRPSHRSDRHVGGKGRSPDGRGAGHGRRRASRRRCRRNRGVPRRSRRPRACPNVRPSGDARRGSARSCTRCRPTPRKRSATTSRARTSTPFTSPTNRRGLITTTRRRLHRSR